MINKMKPVAEITLLEHTAVEFATAAIQNSSLGQPIIGSEDLARMLAACPALASDFLDRVDEFIEKNSLVKRKHGHG